jgi:hypothetical protein
VDANLQRIIDVLGLEPHPEGGFFRETFRSDQILEAEGGKRSASTAILFLLPAGAFSAFHLIRGAAEIWHHYRGAPVEIHTIAPGGEHRVEVLGAEVERGQRPQILVPAETLQAAVNRSAGYALCGCTVTPGFDFADFEMPRGDELVGRFPEHEPVIRRLTRG